MSDASPRSGGGAPESGGQRPSGDAHRWIAAGAVLCAVATLMFYAADLAGGTSPAPPPAPEAPTAPTPEPAESAGPDASAESAGETTAPDGGTAGLPDPLPYSPPIRLEVPSVGIDTDLGRVRRTEEGNIGAPDLADADRAAWYELSVSPGELGTSVIVGHVDSRDRPAVFHRLATVEPGDRVRVTRTDGRVAEFAVDAVRVFPKAAFPARDVLKPRGRPELRLITCGGRFDRESGYPENVIVFARMIG